MRFLLLLLLVHSFSETAWSSSIFSNATFVPDIALVEAQKRSASFIHAGLSQPWPAYRTARGGLLRGPRYCFESEEPRAALTCEGNFWNALNLWRRALGFPGEEKGHSLAWQETISGPDPLDWKTLQPEYCYLDWINYPGMPKTWNSKVPDDTLVISLVKNSGTSSATVGYKGVNQGRHPHHMSIGDRASTNAIAHELGHVFGMAHEHTRNDRDQYVLFNCHNVEGYADALGHAMSNGYSAGEAERKLCEDFEFARDYNFYNVAFIKNGIVSNDPKQKGNLDEEGGYDIDSIMQYASYAFGDVQRCYEDKDNCPLLRIKKGEQGRDIGTALIPMPNHVSQGDIAWVKKHYCWPAVAGQTCPT